MNRVAPRLAAANRLASMAVSQKTAAAELELSWPDTIAF